MSEAQKRCYDEFFPRYGVPFEKKPMDYALCFGRERPIVIEIGFGMGIATAQIARQNPDINYLGIEVHRPGIGRLLWEIKEQKLENIRIIEHDAVEVLENMVSDRSIQGLHVFFPDPWHKKRHHKRRLISRPFTNLLGAKLCPSGYIYMATDWAEYADWSLRELSAVPELINPYGKFAPPQPWRPQTKFEQKGLKKRHEVYELMFIAASGFQDIN
jgi:tRNA (guanine-N7-)-methyltransferase